MKHPILFDTFKSEEETVEGFNVYFQQNIKVIRNNFEAPE